MDGGGDVNRAPGDGPGSERREPNPDPPVPMIQPPYEQSRVRPSGSRFAVVGVFLFVVVAIVIIMFVHVS
jgi:hypothetical protein